MKLLDAYNSLTETAKNEAVVGCKALLEAQGKQVSIEYLKQVNLAIRVNPCSDEVAKVISGYYRGQIGINVSKDDVLANIKVPPDGNAAATV